MFVYSLRNYKKTNTKLQNLEMFGLETLVTCALFVASSAITIVLLLKVVVKVQTFKRQFAKRSLVVGFFHPYCNAGGGGERVLWCAIRALQTRYQHVECVVYTGDKDSSAKDILNKAHHTFNIILPRDVHFVFLKTRTLVEAKHYPILTLLGQSLGSLILGIEALLKCPPDIYLDTMGYAFTLPIFKYIGNCQTGCYVHYPTISTDMLQVVKGRSNTFNNRAVIAKSKVLTKGKLIYYRIFAYMYGVAGRCAETIMVNSSWTSGHIEQLWNKSRNTYKVFPPCDISGFLKLKLERQLKKSFASHLILSIGQFRPEKNHALQVEAFHKFLSGVKEEKSKYQLVMVGGCRNAGDEDRVAALHDLTNRLDLGNSVQILTNVSFQELQELLSAATVGIHTMANEHFGIGVVEFQAAGVITLAHDSGGPKIDIVKTEPKERTGYLASDESGYAEALHEIFSLTPEQSRDVAKAARESCNRFSEEQFETSLLDAVQSLLSSPGKTD